MFLGEYKHSVDAKGRVAIPTKFRDALKKGAVVTRGLDKSLVIYSMTEWETLAEKLSKLPISQARSRAFTRLMLAGAMDVRIDKQGRIAIPEYLRSYAGITKTLVVAGLYNRLELWDEATWESYKKETEDNSSSIAEELGELGI